MSFFEKFRSLPGYSEADFDAIIARVEGMDASERRPQDYRIAMLAQRGRDGDLTLSKDEAQAAEIVALQVKQETDEMDAINLPPGSRLH